MSYRTELIQVAASALAAAQVDECDTTAISPNTAEGARGLEVFQGLLRAVLEERQRQEIKWGTRNGKTAGPAFWLTVVAEEIGEVAEETHGAMTTGEAQVLLDLIDVGSAARAELERR